jgi:hypothetical protein
MLMSGSGGQKMRGGSLVEARQCAKGEDDAAGKGLETISGA